MPHGKKWRWDQQNPHGMGYDSVHGMIKKNDALIFRAIADGESWCIIPHPDGLGYTTLMNTVLFEHRIDLLKLIIERHAAEKDSIFSRPVSRYLWQHVAEEAVYSSWEALRRETCIRYSKTQEQCDVEYQMFSLMFECGGCPIEELVYKPWGIRLTVENKIYQRIVCELGKRQASSAIAWCAKQAGESWSDIVEPLNNIFDAATFEDYWNKINVYAE